MNYYVDNIEYHYKNPALFVSIIDDVYEFTKFANMYYPNYKNWYYDKHIEGIGNGRTIIFVRDNVTRKIVGVCNLKNNREEKKLCSLYVDEKYRKQGIGFKLLDYAFNYLRTNKPVFSVNSKNYNDYKNIINGNDWNLKEILGNYYMYGDCEYVYNGKIRKKIK